MIATATDNRNDNQVCWPTRNFQAMTMRDRHSHGD